MITINKDILAEAESLIDNHFGSIEDLPQHLQNTIVNVHYKYCYLGKELAGNFALPEIVARADGLDEGMNALIEELASVNAAVKNMPPMIRALRTFEDSGAYELAVKILIATFKYNISKAGDYAVTDLEAKMKSLESSADEIPGLWKLIETRIIE